MPSTDFDWLFWATLPVVAIAGLWWVVKVLNGDEIGSPPTGWRECTKLRLKAIYFTKLMVYALVWLWVVTVNVAFPLAGLFFALFVNQDSAEWILFVIMGIVPVLWITLLARRTSLKWPLFVSFALAWCSIANLAFPVVGPIGIGMLIVQLIGRRSIFARSRISAVKTRVSPRGMMEGASDD